MAIVIVDNYDSFTYNLYQLVSSVTASHVQVVRNDDYRTWYSIDPDSLEALIISPGPGRPECDSDFGISRRALAYDVPVLGIGLGHQGLCHREGGSVVAAPEPWHGRTSAIKHDGSGIFAGLPTPFLATRNHSLMVADVPGTLRITACTFDLSGKKLVMGLEHRTRAQWGVQFHPASVTTQYGRELIDNFLQLARVRSQRRKTITASRAFEDPRCLGSHAEHRKPTNRFRLIARRLKHQPDSADVYSQLFASQKGAFWLDSSSVIEGLSRFSILGACGPHGEWVTADANQGVTVRHSNGTVTHLEQGIFDYLGQQTVERAVSGCGCDCDFTLGYVGYLGYEIKAECGGDAVHKSDLPDAGFVFCDRAVVIDHKLGETWLLALARRESRDETEATSWLDRAERAVHSTVNTGPDERESVSPTVFMPVVERESPAECADNIRQCMTEIRAGETYEVCLTTTATVDATIDTLDAYRDFRRRNPVPYGALLQFPGVDVLCGSPEGLVKVSADRVVEGKAIKGTRPRGRTPGDDAMLAEDLRTALKDRAENLILLDLLRSDLGQVAVVGSVYALNMFAVERHATFHQLVSTIRAKLRDDVSPAQCVRAVFPGGSVTGAPKRRTMQIIDRLEGGPRGIYSGAIGYFSLSGAIDLNTAIQTIVVHDDRITVSTGGAIVALTDAEEELAEMRLKAHGLVDSIRATGRSPRLPVRYPRHDAQKPSYSPGREGSWVINVRDRNGDSR
jgi:para-aminobenzoate synthetase